MNDHSNKLLQELAEAIELLRENFLLPGDGEQDGKTIDELKMFRRGLAAMLASLGDPFTNYIPPDQYNTYRSRKKEKLVGIGLQVEFDQDNRAVVIGALSGAPSDVPGLETGDELLQIDGSNVTGTDMRTVNDLLNGPEGSIATLSVLDDAGRRRDLRVPRREVDVDYLSSRMLSDKILHIRISWFSGTVYRDFQDRVDAGLREGMQGLILDIRSNSGGSIISTRNIFSSLCGDQVMYYARSRQCGNTPDRILGEHRFDFPVAVIVDGGTFSAGEVLAGALQDHDRALLVGTKTGGKGSMQHVLPLEGAIGGAIRVTTAINCTPSGRVVQGNGIVPDHEIRQPWPELFVEDGPQNLPPQGRELLRRLRREKLVRAHGADPVDAVWRAGDMQLAESVRQLRLRLG